MMTFEKQSSLTLALGAHVAQNLAMKKIMKSKWFANHVADGFRHGLHGVVDASARSKALQFGSGALLPEIHSAYSEAHALGRQVAEHFPKEKHAELAELLSSGRLSNAVDLPHNLRKKVDEFQYQAYRQVSPYIERPHEHLVPGHPSARTQVLGGLATAVADPITGVLNSGKNLLNSEHFGKLKAIKAMKAQAKESLVLKPLEEGVAHPGSKFNRIRDKLQETFVSPVPVAIKRLSAKGAQIEQDALTKGSPLREAIFGHIRKKLGEKAVSEAAHVAGELAKQKVLTKGVEKVRERFTKQSSLNQGATPNRYLEKLASSGIHIKPSHEGLLHSKLGVPEGEELSASDLSAAKAKAKASGDTKTLRQITFAENAKKWKHG